MLAGVGQLGAWDRLQAFGGAREPLLEIAPDEARIRHAHGDLASVDVEADLVEALVRTTEAQDGNVDG